MRNETLRTRVGIPLVIGAAVVLAGCTASSSGTTTTSTAGAPTSTSSGPAVNGPGVSKTQIDIGAISSRTGLLAGYFGGLSPGMIAYFDALDAKGGINGRKLVLTDNLDDGGSPSQFTADVHTLIDQDHVFAIGVASAWFTPGYFVSTKTPTYGYNVSGNWENAPNLFAAGGSTQVYSSAIPSLAYFVDKIGAKSVGFISYGQSIASSYDACTTYATDLKAAGYDVNFVDVSAGVSGTYTSDVQRLQQAGSQLLVSCMQASDNITLSRDIQQYGVKVKQLWLNGYDQTLLDQYSAEMQNVYLDNTGSVPFEAADKNRYGDTYAGMQQYIADMNKYEPAYTYNGVAFQGWQSAALLAAGIEAAGNDLSQANVIAKTNEITDFTAGGLSAPVNWVNAHTKSLPPNCNAFLQVQGKQYVPVFGPGKQVFVCLGAGTKHPAPVTPPPGTPGA